MTIWGVNCNKLKLIVLIFRGRIFVKVSLFIGKTFMLPHSPCLFLGSQNSIFIHWHGESNIEAQKNLLQTNEKKRIHIIVL